MKRNKMRTPSSIIPKEKVFDTTLTRRRKTTLLGGGAIALLIILLVVIGIALSLFTAMYRPVSAITEVTMPTPSLESENKPRATPSLTPLPSLVSTLTRTLVTTSLITSTPNEPNTTNSRVNPINHVEMVFVPAGEFQMGGDADDAVSECLMFRSKCKRSWFTDEEPIHNIYVDSFWIDKTEVTNTMFVDFLNKNGNQWEGGSTWLNEQGEYVLIFKNDSGWQFQSGYANHPVNYVSWYGAQAYCEWVGGRLPSEVEWEKVASWDVEKNIKYTYPWGNDFDCTKLNSSEGGSCDGYVMTSPVGKFPLGASFYGAYDMAGNVREWTADWYDIYAGNGGVASANDKSKRVIRGGSWFNYEDLSRTSFRYLDYPSKTYRNVGFRCVSSP